ncbi:MAG: hypothetical protein AUG51_08240 [Acidobacteria bacterium 13_1_20CM_3_53_8]|nr:MAG: hypothetical protein AUG51_08240 [Acidobacteria bacterium 13_1_20CM_3_53_8]
MPQLNFKNGEKNNMRKSFRRSLSMAAVTACLMLAALTSASATGGYITSNGRADGTTQSASAADGGGYLGGGGFTDGGGTLGSGNIRTTTGGDGGGGLGSGNVMFAIGQLFINLFG